MEKVAGADQVATAVRPAFNALRFGSAALLYFLLTFSQQHGFSRSDLLGGITTGASFTLGVLLQLVGLRYTTPSVSAFLTSLAVVFTPLAQAFVLHRRVGPRVWLSIALAAAVVYCMEPVFAIAYSDLLGAESITQFTLAGGGIILVAVLLIAKA